MSLPLHLRRFLGLDIGSNLLRIDERHRADVLIHSCALQIPIRDFRYVQDLPKISQVASMVKNAVTAFYEGELTAVPQEHILLVQGALGGLFETIQRRLLSADLAHYLSTAKRRVPLKFAEDDAMIALDSWSLIGAMLVSLCTTCQTKAGLPWLTDARNPGVVPKNALIMVNRINEMLSAHRQKLIDVSSMAIRNDDTKKAWAKRRQIFVWKEQFDVKASDRFKAFARGFLKSVDRKIYEGIDSLECVEGRMVPA